MYLVLASKSPRRKEILANAGYKFKVIVSSVDENVEETSPIEKVAAIARKKGLDVYSKCTQDAVVISADTIVSINGEILGKPKDIDDARKMISMLQGKTHQVYTAVFIKSSNDEYQFVEKTDVHVANMTSDQIENYIKTTEPYDKAGGYGIQGIFGQYITGINGDYFNVMGLPINRAFAETIVRIRIHYSLLRKLRHIELPLVHVLSPLEDHRLEAAHEKPQRSEHSCGAGSYNHNRLSIRHILIFFENIILHCFIRLIDLDPVTVEDIVAGIDRTAHDPVADLLLHLRRHSESLYGCGLYFVC